MARCPVCGNDHPQFYDMGNGNVVDYPCGNDRRADNTGIDDGPYLPGREPRKKSTLKTADEIKKIRTRAWATRREKYGQRGHR